jgi:hypothetical protein
MCGHEGIVYGRSVNEVIDAISQRTGHNYCATAFSLWRAISAPINFFNKNIHPLFAFIVQEHRYKKRA